MPPSALREEGEKVEALQPVHVADQWPSRAGNGEGGLGRAAVVGRIASEDAAGEGAGVVPSVAIEVAE